MIREPKKVEELLSQAVKIDDQRNEITIYGHRYSGALFKDFALIPVGTEVRIVQRENGVIYAIASEEDVG